MSFIFLYNAVKRERRERWTKRERNKRHTNEISFVLLSHFISLKYKKRSVRMILITMKWSKNKRGKRPSLKKAKSKGSNFNCVCNGSAKHIKNLGSFSFVLFNWFFCALFLFHFLLFSLPLCYIEIKGKENKEEPQWRTNGERILIPINPFPFHLWI